MFFETIKKEINRFRNTKYEIFVFFNDSNAKQHFTENNITYINVYKKNTLLFRIKRKLYLVFKKKKIRTLDEVLHDNKIDLLWILGPFDIDVTVPYVFTVWDLGHRVVPFFPEVSTAGWKWESREKYYQKMLYRASYIITGNETGRKEITDNYPVNPEKIKIIHFPVPSFCFDKIPIPENVPGIQSPYIFYPAQFWAHKNHIALIEAIAYLRDSKKLALNCYFSGSDQGNLTYINGMIGKFHLESQICILGFIDQGTLRYLYKNALAMTYVSFMGPNNLPPFEALALGCPLIFSNIPGHLEQMEGTGIPVNAASPVEIGDAVLSLHENRELRQKLISDGLSFIKKYRGYSYFSEMLKITDNFALYRKTWGENS